jgi:glycosyltransferase involved in cell wall biosynthesis
MAGDLKSKRYSVLHLGKFYPPHRGGMETHLRDLAVRQVSKADVNVLVANTAPRYEQEILEQVRVTRVARLGTIASMPLCPGLTAAIRRTPADLVHIHMPNPGAAFAFLRSGHQGKLVVTHHADTLGRKTLRRFSDIYVRQVMDRASAIIVTSARYLHSSAELTEFRGKCRLIPLGIDPAQVLGRHGTACPAITKDSALPLILAVGRLVPYKGFDVLIRAMKDVNANLVLIGSGPEAPELEKLIDSESVAHKVKMLGHVEDVAGYLRTASIFVLPSITRAEAFGLVQLEAMAAGLPVINTDIDSAVPEVSVHGETGLTVPPGNVRDLSEAIQTLLNDSELRRHFSEAARRRVSSEFTADLMAQRTIALYEEVLGLSTRSVLA